ncbi:MAG: sodium:solute symporter family protein, partial [Pirellula sp.]|nr:sodium:solute symporter family protein [Pirellula sp.]
MLIAAVCVYMLITISIGLIASLRVKGAKDFMVAGRSLPFYMNFACVFATWFGAETLLSISATFTKDGLQGIPGDPFGATACLTLVGIFFARAFYRMDLLTIGDFYHKRYGKVVEVVTSVVITISYLGWTSAQMTALGLVIYVLINVDPMITLNSAILIGAFIVTLYTFFGGMWSVALTDLIQTVVIVIGLLVVAVVMGGQAGGATKVIEHAYDNGKFQLFPKLSGEGAFAAWMTFIGAFLTFALGSIPQQDVFQRVTSAKDEKTAVRGTLFGGAAYFVCAFIPMFIAYSAIVIAPDTYQPLFNMEDEREIQRILPDLILNRAPIAVQILFFGALLSAILSTASGTLLAPSSLFTENVLQPIFKMKDRAMLFTLRAILVGFSVIATIFALQSQSTMYEMVQNAYKVTLVAAFTPLAAGVFWKRSTTQGA